MSLQGSLETIALPDVLSLLASSSKTGELRVTGRVGGQLWLQDGKFIAAKVGQTVDHVEAVFQLLRLSRGDFLFQEGSAPPEPGEMSAVDTVIHQAQERLAEWRIIEAAIPSLDVRARLRSDLPGNEVTLPAGQWRLVVAVAEGLPVRDTLDKLDLGEFDGCRGLKELIDAGLVTIDATPVRFASITPNEAPRLRRRVAGPIGDNGAVHPALAVENDRPTPNGRSSAVDAAAAAVALQTTPVRPRPNRLTAPALEEAVAAAVEASTEVELAPAPVPAPAAESNGSRRPRRVAATRDEVLSQRLRPVHTEMAVPAAVVEPVVAEHAPEPEPEPELEAPEDEPINRGLLLKFLSSVRS